MIHHIGLIMVIQNHVKIISIQKLSNKTRKMQKIEYVVQQPPNLIQKRGLIMALNKEIVQIIKNPNR